MSASVVVLVVATVALAMLVSWLLASLLRVLAPRLGTVDVPDARSSHSRATPTGGGIAFAVVVIASLVVYALALPAGRFPAAITAVAAAAIALLGFADDRREVPARHRLSIHLLVAGVWLVLGVGSAAMGQWWGPLSAQPAIVAITALLVVTWLINLYNFMDGIDGIASVQALTVFAVAAALLAAGGERGLAWLLLSWAGAVAGFVILNWSPARLFMGDAGSGLLGFLTAAAAIGGGVAGGPGPAVWLILVACFAADTTLTLIRRGARGERLTQPHRNHAYQILSRCWCSHARVALLVGGVNLCWLAPLAWLAWQSPQAAWLLVVIAYVPPAAVVLLCGAGRV